LAHSPNALATQGYQSVGSQTTTIISYTREELTEVVSLVPTLHACAHALAGASCTVE